MLKDQPIRPVLNDLPRKWMIDEQLELIVWYFPDQAIAGFELIYDRNYSEHSLRWMERSGFQHGSLDDENSQCGYPQTPLVRDGGTFPKERVMAEFRERSRELPGNLVDFILQKVAEYGGKPGPARTQPIS